MGTEFLIPFFVEPSVYVVPVWSQKKEINK
jgi:hypothetical protein